MRTGKIGKRSREQKWSAEWCARSYCIFACVAGRGILRGREFEWLRWEGGPLRAALADVLRVHEWAYVRALQQVPPSCAACRHPLQGLASALSLDGHVLASHMMGGCSLRDMRWYAC